MKQLPESAYTPITLFIGAISYLPCVWLLADSWEVKFTTQGVGAVLYLGIGCSLLAAWFWNKGLKKHNVNASGLYLALEPVFGVFLGVILLGERFDFIGSIGASVIFISVFYSSYLKTKEASKNNI